MYSLGSILAVSLNSMAKNKINCAKLHTEAIKIKHLLQNEGVSRTSQHQNHQSAAI